MATQWAARAVRLRMHGGRRDVRGSRIKAWATAITPRTQDFSRWYQDVLREAQLADYGPVRGTMVVRPYGYAIWERVQQWLDQKFKEEGVENAYFPCFIPQSFLAKEADHVEGFSPEVAVVTHAGGKDLDEPLAVRPTSEAIINHMFAQWIQSYRDLPLMVNQWSNAVRWELRPRPFIRTSEFLWQEGHTAHVSPDEAQERAHRMLAIYAQLAEDIASLPVVTGKKSENERFAGASDTLTMEAMMGDRRALQAATSHNLADNFAKAFDTTFLDSDGSEKHPFQTSWGLSTRFIGGIIMAHGDDRGLRLPPQLAPIQVVVVPIYKKGHDANHLRDFAHQIHAALRRGGIRAKVDDSERESAGSKFNEWELKGVPVRVEVGPRDVESNDCVLARRDAGKEGKVQASADPDSLVEGVSRLLSEVGEALHADAAGFRERNTADVSSFAELKEAVSEGLWARGPWAGSAADEEAVQDATGATLRCFPFDSPSPSSPCLYTSRPGASQAIFARAY